MQPSYPTIQSGCYGLQYRQYVGREGSVGIRAGLSGDRIPMSARFSASVHTGPVAHTASYTMDTGSLSRG
jgi:hypothetical protein